jgi:hypothetical protein
LLLTIDQSFVPFDTEKVATARRILKKSLFGEQSLLSLHFRFLTTMSFMHASASSLPLGLCNWRLRDQDGGRLRGCVFLPDNDPRDLLEELWEKLSTSIALTSHGLMSLLFPTMMRPHSPGNRPLKKLTHFARFANGVGPASENTITPTSARAGTSERATGRVPQGQRNNQARKMDGHRARSRIDRPRKTGRNVDDGCLANAGVPDWTLWRRRKSER